MVDNGGETGKTGEAECGTSETGEGEGETEGKTGETYCETGETEGGTGEREDETEGEREDETEGKTGETEVKQKVKQEEKNTELLDRKFLS